MWQIPAEKCKPGFIQHTIGYPLGMDMYGGSFLYHMAPNYIQVGGGPVAARHVGGRQGVWCVWHVCACVVCARVCLRVRLWVGCVWGRHGGGVWVALWKWHWGQCFVLCVGVVGVVACVACVRGHASVERLAGSVCVCVCWCLHSP